MADVRAGSAAALPAWRRPRTAIAAAGLLTAGAVGVVAFAQLTGPPTVSTLGMVTFNQQLQVPPLAASSITADGTHVFDLTAQIGATQLLPGAATQTAGYNGRYLGPTIRAARGDKVEVNIHNGLSDATTLHWHGMHLPAADDGGPHQPIEPGASRSPAWTIKQPAATLWYHPHLHGTTENQVGKGLAGMVILDDEAEMALPLPRTYGVDDLPVIVQDVAFDSSNQLVNRDGAFSGSLGDRILVNGTPNPYLTVTTQVVRLRLLNASVARVFDFAFSDGRSFNQIASDGGLFQKPLATTSLQLSPGERGEILVQVTPGERVTLQSNQPELGDIRNSGEGDGDQFDVLQLRAAQSLRQAGKVPQSLVPIEKLQETDVATTRTFVLNGTEINDQDASMSRIDQVVRLGDTEIWEVTNRMTAPHSFHVHDVQFQVLDIAGSPPPPELAGWKDTVYLPPRTRLRLIMKFTDYADNTHPYMYHCHLLRHEDEGMMGQFIVLEPGEPVPATVPIIGAGRPSHEH